VSLKNKNLNYIFFCYIVGFIEIDTHG